MRVKKVVYLDMFNPSKEFEAANKLKVGLEYSNWILHEYVRLNTRCLCKHPNITNDYCSYGKCRHHYTEHASWANGMWIKDEDLR